MYIKELVLENFKSFGRKTTLPFHDDFTTISGPNGSGKSNIIDAILFGLGLARTRGIRARKLTDLIYNPGHDGDELNSDAPSEASVTITLDNSEGTLSRGQVESAVGSTDIGNVDTITVRRRVKRTSDNYYSYYYLNGRSVNLSDIQDLLGQAGVTPEGYNVVMQGDVTGIINMTPRERREIIDEIAGVAEFDEKTAAASEELETVADRVHEATLRVEEKATRLEQLDDEREAALAYQALRDEREQYESYQQAAELEQLRETQAEVEESLAGLEETLEDEQRVLDTYQGRVDRLQGELAELNREIEQTGEDEQLAIKREIEEIKGDIDRYETRIADAEERIADAESTRRQAFVNLDRTQEEIEELSDTIRDRKLEKARITRSIDSLKEERKSVVAELEATDSAFEELRDSLQERNDALAAAKRAKRDLQHQQDRMLDDARRRSEEIDSLTARRSELEHDRERLEQSIADLERELDRATQNVEQIDAVIEDLKDERGQLQTDIESVREKLDAAHQEYATLEAQATENGDRSYGRAVTTILNGSLDGVHGTVGQLGGVDPEYADACETAAGARLANVVVDDDEVGARCIEHLKSRNAGRATFLPISEMQDRRLPSAPDADDVIDFAINLVDFDPQYAGIFSYVLGATLVVENMDAARRYMGSYRLVTLDGDLVEQSGAMTGGSRSGSRYSFSKTGKGRLERLAEEINQLETQRSKLQQELHDVEERVDAARDRKADAIEQRREIEAELGAAQREYDDLDGKREEIEQSLAELEDERAEVDERMSALGVEISAVDTQIGEIEADIADLEAELADSEIPALTARIEELDEELADLGEQRTRIDGKLNELQLEQGYKESAIEDLKDTIETAQNRKAELGDQIDEYEESIEAEQDRLAEKRAAIADLEEELTALKAEREELQDEITAAASERDEQRGRVQDLRSEIMATEGQVAELEEEVESLEAAVGEYDPDELPDHETVTSELERLTEEMAALEPVNMLAIDEYDAVAEELETLERQRTILEEERDAILERIETYAAQKKETFMDAFDGINAHFEEIFGRLSNGSGSLHLEDQDDPFDGGLTMEARPADKPIQRLEAMSGGEKSLTALAFIFAIQRYHPAPFYALDEIDAFLDAVNADRVGELLDELAEKAQFIVVSHRSALLERSSRAIGVTMQENNLSAVTGIALGSPEAGVPADD